MPPAALARRFGLLAPRYRRGAWSRVEQTFGRVVSSEAAMPALPHIVLVRCRDSRTDSPRLLEQLRARNATFVVYQKNSSRCNRDPGLRPHEVVTLSHNKGDE